MWELLGRIDGTTLVQARLQAHWAVQAIAAAADGWLAHREDDSHTAMTWEPQRGALLGEAAPSGLAVALVLDSLTLIAVHGKDEVAALPLGGCTLTEALAWVDGQHAAAASATPRGIAVRRYDMPAHLVGSGSAFTVDREALAELAAWYAIGAEALHRIVVEPLRVWPHHFDLGTIVFLDPPGEQARQIGAGLSPGDGSYAEPYFYITPYPVATGTDWPALAGGGLWRHESWTGAVLTASALIANADRRASANAFLTSALLGARAVVPP